VTPSATVSMAEVGNPATQTSALRQEDSSHNLGKSAQVTLVSRGDPLTELVKQLKMQVGHEVWTLIDLVAFSVPYRALSRNPAVSDKTLDIVGISDFFPTNKPCFIVLSPATSPPSGARPT
jgi:hypothetical protein